MKELKISIPGTTVIISGFFGHSFSGLLSPLLGFKKGLLVSQITSVAEDITKETIQNWIKRGFIQSPKNGRFYDENQVARIFIINALRDAIELEDIKFLLAYTQGKTEANALSERELLEVFNEAVVKTAAILPGSAEQYTEIIARDVMPGLDKETGVKNRLITVLPVMLTAYYSNLLRKQAHSYIFEIKRKHNA